MLPVALAVPPVAKLPPVMLPVALEVPPVAKLPPVMVAAALINPPVRTLPPVMLPAALTTVPALTNPVTLKLVPVAAPIFGVVSCAPVLTMILPPPSNAVVTLSTKALNCDPIKLRPAEVLAVYDPLPENCTHVMLVVPTVTGAFVLQTNPESALTVPCSTNVNALGNSDP